MSPARQPTAGRIVARRGHAGAIATLLACAAALVGWAGLPTTTAVPLTTATKTFGHAVKNGALPPTAQGETVVIEHNCSAAPCVVNQLHFPSIYPKNMKDWDWQDGVLRFYVDGETTASIEITLLELSWVSRYASPSHASLHPGESGGQYDNRGLPWGVTQFGHTASSGGVSSTIRIPFGKSLRVTIQAPPGTNTTSVWWGIVRGVENGVVTVGELELPPTARMRVYRVNATLDHLDLVTLASAPSGVSGVVVGTKFDATSANDGYLEACMRLYPTAAATDPVFLSSGAEDYFLSASYFDEGEFVTPNSGLTFKDRQGGIGAYKMHDLRDPVVWHDGFKLQFRSGESTSGCGSEQQCPNQYCPPGAAARSPPREVARDVEAILQSRADRLSSAAFVGATAPPNGTCVPGPIAYGFDRPGGDGNIGAMKTPSGAKCTGVAMVNATGCSPADCAALCCSTSGCVAWVHGIAAGCDRAGGDPNAVCCWTKRQSTQIAVHKDSDHLSTGEVAGHGGAPAPAPGPGPGPSPIPDPWVPPLAPLPPPGKTVFNTLVYTYEWPTSDTPKAAAAAAGGGGGRDEQARPIGERLEELAELRERGLISAEEHAAARRAALGLDR